jgi:hypothetical protein
MIFGGSQFDPGIPDAIAKARRLVKAGPRVRFEGERDTAGASPIVYSGFSYPDLSLPAFE